MKINDVPSDIVKKIAEGDNPAFVNILKSNKGFLEKIVSSTMRKSSQYSEFDDLMQVARIALFKAANEYNSNKGKFGTYAYVVVQNDVRGYLNKEQKHECVHLEQLKSDGSGSYHENRFALDNKVYDARNFENILVNEMIKNDALEELSEFEKEMYELLMKGNSINRCSDIMGMSKRNMRHWWNDEGAYKLSQIVKEIGQFKVEELHGVYYILQENS